MHRAGSDSPCSSSATRPLPREALALSPNLVLLVDDDGCILQVGGRFRELLDMTEAEIEGRPLRDLILPRDRSLLPHSLEELVGWEKRHRHPLELHLRYGASAGDEAEGGQMAGAVGQTADRWRLFSFSATDLRHDERVGALLLSLQPIGQPGAWNVSRSLLFEAVEAANSCIVIADLQQTDQPLVYCNEGFRKLTGYEDDDIVGENCRFLQRRPDGSRDDQQPGLDEIRKAIATGQFVATTLRNYTKTGELFHNELFLTPVHQDGQLVAYIGVQNDVTERVNTEKQLRQREEAIRSFFDAAPMLMGLLELRNHVADPTRPESWREAGHVMINRHAVDVFGIDQSADSTGKTLADVGLDGECVQCFAEGLAAAVREQVAQRFECEVDSLAHDNTRRRFRVVVNLVRPGDGEPPRCSYIAEDVTDTARAERRRKMLEAAVENVDDSILITDATIEEPGPHILYINEGFTRLTGYKPDEILGKTPRVLQGPLTDRGVLDRLRRNLERGENFAGDTTNYRKDGTPYQVAWTLAPIRENGKIVQWVAAQRDITHRRQLERQVLEVQQREQQRIARDLHDTVAQSLNMLTLYVGTVRRELEETGAATPEQLEQLREAANQARQAAEQARNLSHSLTPVTLGDGGLAAALQRLAERSQLAYGITCETDCDAASPIRNEDVATHLYRIASEAVGNAMRHARPSRVTIQLIHLGDGNGRLLVTDDGTGVADDRLPIASGEHPDSSHDTGGLGMHTMLYRAGLLGGTLSITRGPGPHDRPGTVVNVTFPA